MAAQPPPNAYQSPEYVSAIKDHVLSADLQAEMADELAMLHRARNRFAACAGRYLFVQAMNVSFFNGISRSPTLQPLRAVHGTFVITLIINLHSFYDQSTHNGKGNVLLNRLKNSICDHRDDIETSRKALGIDRRDTKRLIKKIERTFKRIETGAGKDSFARIKAWRHGEYAHIDLIPGRTEARPELRDITRCFVLTAKVLRDIYSLLSQSGKDELMLRIRGVLKRQAQQFVDSIHPLPARPPRKRGFGISLLPA